MPGSRCRGETEKGEIKKEGELMECMEISESCNSTIKLGEFCSGGEASCLPLPSSLPSRQFCSYLRFDSPYLHPSFSSARHPLIPRPRCTREKAKVVRSFVSLLSFPLSLSLSPSPTASLPKSTFRRW